ncbi:hypothetical protein M422DRAFT_254139 [Sphaerobolus stellatus SS14]|uniref:Unplaced genomic scaffold SPHSTscaffold_53, whole genome shotgun sequence n=1 Tax=Sphaerobolus stellatus (strain SS14) TaxID=990650 RepID=A0A0C9UHZ3_SPHS4|nr:hypothetical protein M422DRAFT_254139 [Sphaerobolus stellatus SS14]
MVSVQPGHIAVHILGTNHGLFRTYKGVNLPDTTQPGAWGSEVQLGTWCYSPYVISRIQDEYSCFLVSESHELCQSDFDQTTSVGMPAFRGLGGQLSSPPFACNRKASGTLHIFHVGMDKALYHKAWDGINYYPEGCWERLEGKFLDGGACAAVSCGDDEVDVFAIGATTGKLHHYHWKEGAGWKLEEDLPGYWWGDVAVVSPENGKINVFGVDDSSQIHRVVCSKENEKWKYEHERISGHYKTVSAITSAPNCVDIIALDYKCAPYHKRWEQDDESAWEHIDGALKERPWLVCARPNGVCLYSIAFNGTPCVKVRDPNSGGWAGWFFIAGTAIGSIA